MAAPDLRQKLSILADAAKYDASCASSGASRRGSLTSADWMLIPAGGSRTIQFTSLGGVYDPAAQLTATVAEANW